MDNEALNEVTSVLGFGTVVHSGLALIFNESWMSPV